jgi:hypothetical protein
MKFAQLPWLVGALVVATALVSFGFGARVTRLRWLRRESRLRDEFRLAYFRVHAEQQERLRNERNIERVLVRPDLALFRENEMLRDRIATLESAVLILQTERQQIDAARISSQQTVGEKTADQIPVSTVAAVLRSPQSPQSSQSARSDEESQARAAHPSSPVHPSDFSRSLKDRLRIVHSVTDLATSEEPTNMPAPIAEGA